MWDILELDDGKIYRTKLDSMGKETLFPVKGIRAINPNQLDDCWPTSP
jgi:hypothetical protein